jgi:hypothetical protein
MTYTVIFNGKTQEWLNNKELSNIHYTGRVVNGFDEAMVGDSYVYVRSNAEGTQTLAILIPNACEEETVEILNSFLLQFPLVKINNIKIELLNKAYSQNEAFLFFQSNKKIIAKHKKISKILEQEIRNEFQIGFQESFGDIPNEIQSMNDDELLARLSE